jgi:hypothetical protein
MGKTKNHTKLGGEAMQPDEQFASFAASVRENDILDPKTTRLIFLAVSMALGCYP